MRTFEVNIGKGIVEVYEIGEGNETALELIDHLLARNQKLEALAEAARNLPQFSFPAYSLAGVSYVKFTEALRQLDQPHPPQKGGET